MLDLSRPSGSIYIILMSSLLSPVSSPTDAEESARASIISPTDQKLFASYEYNYFTAQKVPEVPRLSMLLVDVAAKMNEMNISLSSRLSGRLSTARKSTRSIVGTPRITPVPADDLLPK